jgi:hypothetical protein
MSDIFVPASLNSADVSLSIANSLSVLVDPKERAKIADDIKAHHALNDIEAKKAAEARALIKQHQDILNETNRVAEKNKADKEALEESQKKFNADCEIERQKIATKWSDVSDAAQTAKDLNAKAEGMINDVASREESLRKAKETHANDVKKLGEDAAALEEKRKGIEKFQIEVSALDTATKSKVEKLKQFNF